VLSLLFAAAIKMNVLMTLVIRKLDALILLRIVMMETNVQPMDVTPLLDVLIKKYVAMIKISVLMTLVMLWKDVSILK
jgi:hypothetical protein